MAQLDPTANFTGPFRFFDLPRELRDMVYHQCWLLTAGLFKYTQDDLEPGNMNITLWGNYQPYGNIFPTFPVWSSSVSTCFKAEAMEEFYLRYRFHAAVQSRGLTSYFWFGSLESEEFHQLQAECELDQFPGTESMSVKQLLNDYLKPVPNAIEPWPTSMAMLKKMENALVDNQGRKSLCISFAVIREVKPGVTVDLSAFESTGFTLDKLVVDMFGIHEKFFLPHTGMLFAALKAEVSRLGHVLVGQKTIVDFSIEVEKIAWFSNSFWRFTVTKA